MGREVAWIDLVRLGHELPGGVEHVNEDLILDIQRALRLPEER